jgi:hypothetical protein
MSLPTDHQSAEMALARVRRLAGLLDLDHPDASYQASKADQLAMAARELAHDLALLGSGRRMHQHLAQVHRAEALPSAAERSFAERLDDHDARPTRRCATAIHRISRRIGTATHHRGRAGPDAKDGHPIHRQPTDPREEVTAMPDRPSWEQLREWIEEGGAEATDGCWVEPDGSCEHGKPSWLLELGLI